MRAALSWGLCLLSACGGEAPSAKARAPGLPDTSIYHLDHAFRDQQDRPLRLPDLQGRVQVAAMVFTHCPYACPVMVQNLKAIDAALPAAARDHVEFLLISMDVARDQPAVLAAYGRREGLDPQRWHLLHGGADAVREFAAALGFRYTEVEGGDFSHSNLLVVLDGDGREAFRHEGLKVEPAVLALQVAAAVRR